MRTVGAQTPLLQRSGAVVLQQDVGVFDQFLDNLDAELCSKVGGHRPLPAVHHLVVEPHTVFVVPPISDFIPGARPLHLDHVRAEIRQVHRAHRRCEVVRNIEHLDAREGTFAVGAWLEHRLSRSFPAL
jgi:hypothetical protein